jgi:hypothetical protein
MYGMEILLCAQKTLYLLIKLHEKGKLSIEALHEHANLKINFLDKCLALPEYSEYSIDSLEVLSYYRNILERSSVSCKTQV